MEDATPPTFPAGEAADVADCFDHMPAIVWAFEGPQLRVTAANAGARASAGNRPHIVGRPIREVLPELEGQQIFEMMEAAYASGTPVAGDQRRVLVDRNGDGRLEEGFFTYTFLPTRHADGSVRGLVVHIVETTAAARDLRAAEEAAELAERRYHRAHEVVLDLQRSLLPAGLPLLPRLRVAARYEVAGSGTAAGGDWFDAVALPDRRVALMVGDVTGHEAPAAGAMGQLRAVALAQLDAGAGPAEVLARLDHFARLDAATTAATVCLVVLDPATGELVAASHAHPPPLLVDGAGGTRFLPLAPAQPG